MATVFGSSASFPYASQSGPLVDKGAPYATIGQV